MFIALALAAAPVATDEEIGARFKAYEDCVMARAEGWARAPDPAKDIAAAAAAACKSEEIALREATIPDPRTRKTQADMLEYDSRTAVLEGALKGIEQRAMARILDLRVKK